MRRWVVWGEAVMVEGVGRRCFWWADVAWLRVFGRCNAVQCSAGHVAWFECVCGKGLRTCFCMGKEV